MFKLFLDVVSFSVVCGISAACVAIHTRTDANNLVTFASTTCLPEQKETIHLVPVLRKESCSGQIEDLAHVYSADCLSYCLTKSSAKSDALHRAVSTGILPNLDMHPPFRSLLKAQSLYIQVVTEHSRSSGTLFVSFFGYILLSATR